MLGRLVDLDDGDGDDGREDDRLEDEADSAVDANDNISLKCLTSSSKFLMNSLSV